MSRLLRTTVCVTLLSSSSLFAQFVPIPGPIDVDGLRNRVLQHAAAASGLALDSLVPIGLSDKPTAAETWGFEVMVVPALFVRNTPELKNGPGLLITRVCDGSPAWKVGLRKGQVLLDVDDCRLNGLSDLPALTEPRFATILTDDGFRLFVVFVNAARHRIVTFSRIFVPFGPPLSQGNLEQRDAFVACQKDSSPAQFQESQT